MLVWQNFTKTQISLNSILGNILSKAQMLVWQNFYKYSKAQVLPLEIFWKNCTKPKYYHWQYFIKSSNTSLAKFYKYSKAQVLPMAIFYQKPKYYHWQYFTKVQYYFGNILSTTQNYYFFDK